MAHQENLVEAAITAALEKYCNEESRPQITQFRPYSRQQGADMRLYCGDIVGIVDHSKVLLLEIKERNCQSGVLIEFNEEQFSENLVFEEIGVPIAYAYNTEPVKQLKYHAGPKSGNWAEEALRQIKRSPPSRLSNECPQTDQHETLLDWLLRPEGEDGLAAFGRIHGAIQGPEDLRNGMLVLIYSPTKHQLLTLTSQQLDKVVACLQNNSSLTLFQQTKLQKILKESAAVFNSFAKTPPAAPAAPDQPDDDDHVSGGPRLGF